MNKARLLLKAQKVRGLISHKIGFKVSAFDRIWLKSKGILGFYREQKKSSPWSQFEEYKQRKKLLFKRIKYGTIGLFLVIGFLAWLLDYIPRKNREFWKKGNCLAKTKITVWGYKGCWHLFNCLAIFETLFLSFSVFSNMSFLSLRLVILLEKLWTITQSD